MPEERICDQKIYASILSTVSRDGDESIQHQRQRLADNYAPFAAIAANSPRALRNMAL